MQGRLMLYVQTKAYDIQSLLVVYVPTSVLCLFFSSMASKRLGFLLNDFTTVLVIAWYRIVVTKFSLVQDVK